MPLLYELILIISFAGFTAQLAFFYFFLLNGRWLQALGLAKGVVYLAAYRVVDIIANKVHKAERTHFKTGCFQQGIDGLKIGYSLFGQFQCLEVVGSGNMVYDKTRCILA